MPPHKRNINIGERQRVPNGRQDGVAALVDIGQWTLAITVAARVVRVTLFLPSQDLTARDATPFHNSP